VPPEYQPLRDKLAASEANLLKSQELFALSFQHSPALMTIAALPGGEFIEVNEAFLENVGLAREQVLGKTTLDLDLWVDTPQREVFIQQIAANVTVRDFEAEFNTGSGKTRFYLLNADRIELRGQPCILTVAIDISARRRLSRAEEALAVVERRYRNLFENAAEGLYLSSVEGNFIDVNPALARMFGYSNAATCIADINQIDRQIYVDPQRRKDFFDRVQTSDLVTDFESEIRRADGSTIWVSESVNIVRNESGEIDHLEGLAVDVTDRREAARALAEARDAADAANRAKSQFLASMSHELRTPLNGILGFTQILKRDAELAAKHQHGVGVIHESAEHLLSLINDVLDLSKVEAGRLELHPGSFDPAALLAGVVELLAPKAREQGLSFVSNISADLPSRVIADSARLRQVLLNLVANALKFTREGAITLTASRISSSDTSSNHSSIRFSVEDTGCGIAPAELTRIFEPFEQVGPRDIQAEGTGLGLAISHKLVDALGGALDAHSTVDQGSQFSFVLSLPHGTETTAPFEPSRPIVGYEGSAKNVLIVDDVLANSEVLAGLLGPVGFAVETAATGEAAIAHVAAHPTDLVLMDLRMPGMGGLAAITQLRETYGPTDLRIIAVSASAYDFDRESALEHGCDDFLPKPVRTDALYQAVGEALGLIWKHVAAPAGSSTPFTENSPPSFRRGGCHLRTRLVR
jgi:PAS domain S-box-containing protein